MIKVLIKLPTVARHPEASLRFPAWEIMCYAAVNLPRHSRHVLHTANKHSTRSPTHTDAHTGAREVLISVFIGNWKGFLKICVHRTCLSAMLRKGIIMKLLWAEGERDTIFHALILNLSPCQHYKIWNALFHRNKRNKILDCMNTFSASYSKLLLSRVPYMLISSLMILERKWMRKCTRMKSCSSSFM